MLTNFFDTIIIGSGISGMTAGIVLAGSGEKVLILEQHKIPGGLMQTYKRESSLFPTGVHRLGSLKEGQPLWYYFKYLDVFDRLKLVKMDEHEFEHYLFPDKTYKIPNGHNAYSQKLKEYFPNEASAIDKYMKELKKVIASVSLYNPSVTPSKDNSLNYTGSVDDYLKSLGISNKLKNVLTANSPLYGLSSDTCPLLTHFLITDSYLNSSFRIDEEATPLADAFCDSFTSRGGKIKLNSHVESIIIEDKQSKGVVLGNGEKIFSKRVIFTGHPSFLLDICPPESFRPVYRKRLNNCKNTPGIFGIAMTWDKESCPVINNDAYVYDAWDTNIQYTRNNLFTGESPSLVFLSALPESCSGKFSVTALTGLTDSDNALILKYRKESLKGKYKEAKEILSESIFRLLKDRWPQIGNDAKIIDSYSPATFERYTYTPSGSAYGIKKTSKNFMQSMFHPATKVKNLFVAGQNITFSGIHGSLVSSIILCSGILGDKNLTDNITKV